MKIKKIKRSMVGISMALSIALITTFTFAATTGSTNVKKLSESDKLKAEKYMLDIGINENAVNNAPDSELSKYVNAKLVAKTDKYYRVTTSSNTIGILNVSDVNSKINMVEISKEQCEKEARDYKTNQSKSPNTEDVQITNLSVSNKKPTSWMEVVVTANYQGDKIYTISNACKWLTTPAYRQLDVIGLGHDNKVTTLGGTEYFYSQCYRSGAWPGWVTSKKYTNEARENVGGCGFKWQLPGNVISRTPQTYSDFYCYMSYNIKISQDNWSGDLSIFGEYKHQQAIIKFSPSFTYIGASMTLKSVNKYDSADCLLRLHTEGW